MMLPINFVTSRCKQKKQTRYENKDSDFSEALYHQEPDS